MNKFRDFHFKGQTEGEEIIKIIRRHWFNILQQYFVVIGMVLVMLASLAIVPTFVNLSDPNLYGLFLLVESTFSILIWIVAFIIWVDYYFDVWIITNHRIVNIEQKALFVRTVSELNFSKIQDVSIEVTGLIPTILNYGDVFVQTAGSRNRFLFHKIPDPYQIKTTIINMQSQSDHYDSDLETPPILPEEEVK